jgi:AraC-like DNA-binding protein
MTGAKSPEQAQSPDRATWYREIAPPPEVADCVLSLWLMQVPLLPGPTKVRILPNACVDIVVYRSDPSRGEGAAAIVAPPRRSYVVGSTLRDFVVRSIGWRHVIGASLRPEGVQPLLGLPAAIIGDRVALLDDVIGPAAGTIEDRVLSAAPERSLEMLGEILVERRRASAPPNALTERAVRSVRRARGRLRIDALAAELNLSPRQLERHFLTHVGLSPKLFSRLVRFDRAVRHLATRGTATWADFASAHGYADQAHFINEFREFAGVPPEEFERESDK